MSVVTDPSQVRLGDRPLIVCDIDEVVLEFLSPLARFLRSHDYDLLPRSFRLHGNIVSVLDGTEMDRDEFDRFHEIFFETQDLWQEPAARAVETLHALAADADIVFLTAMPPRHHEVRRRLLDRFDLCFDMIASEQPKGPIVAALHDRRDLPVAFIDDIQQPPLRCRPCAGVPAAQHDGECRFQAIRTAAYRNNRASVRLDACGRTDAAALLDHDDAGQKQRISADILLRLSNLERNVAMFNLCSHR
jgi:hypothetical protein